MSKLARALGSKFESKQGPVKAATRPSTAMSTSTMTTYRGGTYNTGISEQAVEQKAIEDGEAGSLDPSNVGKNSHPHGVDHLVEGHETATSVIGHDLQDAVQSSDEQLNRQREEVIRTEAKALAAIAEHTSAQRQMLVQRQKMRAAGLPVPGRRNFLHLVLLLLLLFVGDWGLLALGFQIMGLSDRPWIPFLSFTDDLHLAALSAVMGLVFLGHTAGGHVRRIEHALEVRRQAGDNRENFPRPAIFDYVWSLASFVTAVAGMVCLSTIRAEYLKAIGVDADFWAFVGVQFLILVAAIGISFAQANPEAGKWKSVDTALDAATAMLDETVDSHTNTVGLYNAIIDRRLADIAKAGHHVDADAANMRGQIAAYKRRYILAQLEPAQEELFNEHLTAPAYKDGELLKRLTGVTPFPVFSKAVTQKVMDALAAGVQEISTLRAQIDQIEINKLDLPGTAELLDAKRAAASEEESADAAQAPPAPAPAATKLHPLPTATCDDETAGDTDDTSESA